MTAGVPYLVTYAGVQTLTTGIAFATTFLLSRLQTAHWCAVLDLNGKTFEDNSVGTHLG